jgi:hypothetical protein
MTQILPFVTSTIAPPQFKVTLDGVQCNVTVTWNVAAQRYFINVYQVFDGSLVVAIPLVSTANGIELASLTWDQNLLAVIAVMAQPFYRPVGQIVQYTITGCQPTVFNGLFDCMTIDQWTFSYPMATDPGQAIILGAVNRYHDMIAPWVNSTLIYRDGQFLADP